jgi:hypothetical protein
MKTIQKFKRFHLRKKIAITLLFFGGLLVFVGAPFVMHVLSNPARWADTMALGVILMAISPTFFFFKKEDLKISLWIKLLIFLIFFLFAYYFISEIYSFLYREFAHYHPW